MVQPKSIEQINDTTWGFEVAGELVEVGDKRQLTKFKPHLILPRWDGECSLTPSIELTGSVSAPRITDKQVEIETNRSIIRWYPIDPTPQFELGAFRMEITHKVKPPSNHIESWLIGHNVVAYYQPPLTQEEIEEGCFRPDNIVGSYAFYHATRTPMHAGEAIAEKYKACKVVHKPRPRIIDDKGDWCWAELHIDLKTGLQIITIPWDFYNSAQYPIKHDAGADTVGFTGIGGSTTGSTDRIRASKATSGGTGTGNSVSVYCAQTGETELSGGIYLDSDNQLKGSTLEGTAGVADWITMNFTGGDPAITAVDYWLAAKVHSVNLYYDAGAIKYKFRSVAYETGWTTDLALFTESSNQRDYSIYCTYTPAAGDTVVFPTALDAIGETVLALLEKGSWASASQYVEAKGEAVWSAVVIGTADIVVFPVAVDAVGEAVLSKYILSDIAIFPTALSGVGDTASRTIIRGNIALTALAEAVGYTAGPAVVITSPTVLIQLDPVTLLIYSPSGAFKLEADPEVITKVWEAVASTKLGRDVNDTIKVREPQVDVVIGAG